MRLGAAEADWAVAGAGCPPFGAVADCSGGRVVGALTMTLYLLHPVRINIQDRKSVVGQQKTPVSWVLYEGRALMLLAMPGRGQARHQRASQLLRAGLA
jgi:hypothetical protein